jgi:hypothetical protein
LLDGKSRGAKHIYAIRGAPIGTVIPIIGPEVEVIEQDALVLYPKNIYPDGIVGKIGPNNAKGIAIGPRVGGIYCRIEIVEVAPIKTGARRAAIVAGCIKLETCVVTANGHVISVYITVGTGRDAKIAATELEAVNLVQVHMLNKNLCSIASSIG